MIVETNTGNARRYVSSASPRASVVAMVAAGALIMACGLPFALWGNPYPDGVGRFWLGGAGALVLLTLLAAATPISVLRDASRKLVSIILLPTPFVFALVLAAITIIASACIAHWVFSGHASTSDEIAQLWHARILLHGRFSLPVDPNAEFFSLDTVIDRGGWYSQFPIGGPLILTVGALAGAPWLVNPILAGVATIALYHFSRHAFGEVQGRAIACIFATTPFVLLMAGSWMNHVPVLALTTVALALLVEWERAASHGRAWLFAGILGLVLGAIGDVRPLDAVVLSLATGVFQFRVVQQGKREVTDFIPEFTGVVLGLVPVLLANAATTGSPLRFGYDVQYGAAHRPGFHVDPYGAPHTFSRALDYALTYVSGLNVNLFAWPIPGLLFAILTLICTRRMSRWDALLLALFGAQLFAYACYWHDGEFLGPRFLYSVIPAIIVLVGRLPFTAGLRLGEFAGRWSAMAILACVLSTWCIPTLPFGVWTFLRQARASRNALRLDVAGAVHDAHLHNALVFLHEPFRARLERRLWGLGLKRGETPQLIASSDACSLLSAVRAAEVDTSTSGADKSAFVRSRTTQYARNPRALQTSDADIHVTSPSSLTPECEHELREDARIPGASFGAALPLEPIDQGGHINGDVIFVADLGDRNEILRQRFGGRRWYRLGTARTPTGHVQAAVFHY